MSRRHSTTIAKSQTQILGRDSDIAGMIYIYFFNLVSKFYEWFSSTSCRYFFS